MIRSIVLALALVAAGTASAADTGFYFGLSGGQAKYDFEPVRPANAFLPIPFIPALSPEIIPRLNIVAPPAAGWTAPVAGISAFIAPQEVFWIPGEDDEANAWSALVGYRFSRYIAAELAYHDLGTLRDYTPSRTFLSFTSLEVRSKLESAGATLALLGQLPITDQWNVYLRAGGLFADQEVSRQIGTTKFNDSYDSEAFLYGIGTQVDFGSHWTVRLDFQRYDDVGKGNGVGEADVDALTLGVLFRLGGK